MLHSAWIVRLASIVLVVGMVVFSTPPAYAQTCSILGSVFNLQYLSGSFRNGSVQAHIQAAGVDEDWNALPVTLTTEFIDVQGRVVATTTATTISDNNLQAVTILPAPVGWASGLYIVRMTADIGVCGSRSDTLKVLIQ